MSYKFKDDLEKERLLADVEVEMAHLEEAVGNYLGMYFMENFIPIKVIELRNKVVELRSHLDSINE